MAEKVTYTFTNDIEEVAVCSLGAKIVVETYDGEGVTAEYDNPEDKPEIQAILCGKKLTIKETPTLKIFSPKPAEGYRITMKLPVKLFRTLEVNTASGGVEISDSAVTAEVFKLHTASGNVNVNAFFGEVNVKSASGNINITNPSDGAAKSLKISAASGNITADYKAEKYAVNSVSGNTKYSGAVGEGDINVTSGTVTVDYAEWNGDLKVKAVSGNVNVNLPADSGVNVKFDGVSGTVRTDLGNEKGKFISLGKGTNGEFGGSNKHIAEISLVSGTVVLAQRD
ncbi:MAG: DUF4097 family beta strand repeat-containing protein [Oscillospiraceae bacterium]